MYVRRFEILARILKSLILVVYDDVYVCMLDSEDEWLVLSVYDRLY